MNNDSGKRYISIIVALLIIGASFFAGVFYEAEHKDRAESISTISNKAPEIPINADFAPFWKSWEVLNEKFVSTASSSDKKVSDQDRVWGAIEGMVRSLGDPYTIFFPPEDSAMFESDIAGNFEGVGMEVGVRDNVLVVISPLKGTPAYKAGILSGDKILKINDTLTSKLNTDEAVRLIRGKGGTKVTFTILREGKKDPIQISVIRGTINIPTIDNELRKDGVYVIHLYNFSAISADLFRKALREFVSSGSDKLILDLRGNPGGYLEAAVDMASWFLPSGQVIVSEDFKDNRDQIFHRSKGYNIFNKNLKMAILIDGGSASASEILAGALREHNIASLVGTKSYGKGSVQELVKITPNTSLKVTIARWLTPNGNSISAGGLTPDVKVDRTEDDVLKGRDPQLAKAVELLLKK